MRTAINPFKTCVQVVHNMKLILSLILSYCLTVPALAADVETMRAQLNDSESITARTPLLTQVSQIKNVLIIDAVRENDRWFNPEKKMKESSLAKAIADAHKKSVAENTIQAYTEVIRQCQRETSQLQTVPFMRSDSQQAHCYRY
ncbi:hypothetical protein Undi14_11370 [Undibacterium sp. 14-3-2]|uniref:hypothetical protein n=1 Tax=Undibacterium sp. 14-3-2 TaxID=2800129 RepID=UPI001905F323|nr:hypothetical protein [Undibacterium sp. 14-3-2]MBK1890636.1 hypothetical protein [Undibacterium sp. 14-3-2]